MASLQVSLLLSSHQLNYMLMKDKYSRDSVIRANVELHTAAADVYAETEPHYRPESIDRVTGIIRSLQETTTGQSLLDIGCGRGFIIDIAKSYFKTIRGIDVTPAMLEKVNLQSNTSDIKVYECSSDDIRFNNDSFDACTAFAVLHHLHEIAPTLKEVHRVLKHGGVFYSDVDPNYYFWEAISQLPGEADYSDIVRREIDQILHKDDEIQAKFGIDKETFQAAEHLKHVSGGFKEENLVSEFKLAGFSKVEIRSEWMLGEAGIIHGKETARVAEQFRHYMRSLLPLSRHLFKYVSVLAVK